MPSNTPRTSLPAIAALLLAATLWGLIWYPLRLLEQGGLSGLWTSLIMYLSVFVLSLPWLWWHRAEITRRPGLFVLIALLSGWTNIAFILAVLEGHIVRVMLLFYLSPLWAVLLARVFLSEHFTRHTFVMLGLSLTGMLCMLWLPGGMLLTGTGLADIYALTSGMAFAATNVAVRSDRVLPLSVKAVAAWLGVCVLAALGLLLYRQPLPAVAPEIIYGALALGVIGMTIMTLAVLYGVTHMPAQRSSVILLFELVVATISANLLTDETVLLQEWLGGALIVSAALTAAWRQGDYCEV
jgi:drug/metabolite transporter (DMT)-like permease